MQESENQNNIPSNQPNKTVEDSSRIKIKPKVFMQISDVDPEDAEWFREFANRHANKHQFMAFKVMRTIIQNLEPVINNMMLQLNNYDAKSRGLEATIIQIKQNVEDEINAMHQKIDAFILQLNTPPSDQSETDKPYKRPVTQGGTHE